MGLIINDSSSDVVFLSVVTNKKAPDQKIEGLCVLSMIIEKNNLITKDVNFSDLQIAISKK